MEKKGYQYKLRLQALKDLQGEEVNKEPLEFEFVNHDDLFKVIGFMKEKNLFQNSDESVQFALGLKLFSEVMLHNRTHPIFEELGPAFGSFMKRLKG
ncbi:DUF3861 domain-containing protein [Dysgonomonas macrotermitis]|uniref:DUF3861 domain-containing protein n=1 Tax=Dysgonomonas macrotermitis TaxID=1346286 RepID=A0A1M5BRB0_9BACT|nr:DUF3861 domain-containing protein [Dysgonomonas macrotermitis]SHF45094.1 protein of unknown function [Dysgonomonas macrotermitis]